MTLRLAPPLLADFVRIAATMRPDERAQFVALSGLADYDAEAAARALTCITGPAWVAVDDDGRAVLAGGFDPLRPGVYEAWLAGSLEDWQAHGRSFTRICARAIKQLLAGGAHRIQTCALATRTEAHAWYEALGFVREGVLRGYGAHGEDFVMYARTAR